METRDNSTFDSYLDWMQEAKNTDYLSGHHALGSYGAMIIGTSQTDVFSDPPTPDLTIQLCTAGSYWLKGDAGFGRFYEPKVVPGMFGVSAANIPLELEGAGRFDMLLLALPWVRIQSLAHELAGHEVMHFDALHAGMSRDATVESLMRSLWREQNRGGVMGALFADSVTTALVVQLLRLSERPLPRSAVPRRGLSKHDLKRVTEYLNDNLAADVSLATLAGIVCVSPYHFCRLFKYATGLSPHQYVIRERVARARQLILLGDRPVLDVALKVGFCNESHLTRHMKKLYGVSPSQIASRQSDRLTESTGERPQGHIR